MEKHCLASVLITVKDDQFKEIGQAGAYCSKPDGHTGPHFFRATYPYLAFDVDCISDHKETPE